MRVRIRSLIVTIERAPALMTNPILMFVAPFFWGLEVLNTVFGYKAKEIKEWNKTVAKEID